MTNKNGSIGSKQQSKDMLALNLPAVFVNGSNICSGWGIEVGCKGQLNRLQDAVVGKEVEYRCDHCNGIYRRTDGLENINIYNVSEPEKMA